MDDGSFSRPLKGHVVRSCGLDYRMVQLIFLSRSWCMRSLINLLGTVLSYHCPMLITHATVDEAEIPWVSGYLSPSIGVFHSCRRVGQRVLGISEKCHRVADG